jgi:inhibitor of cysteine peptidase
MRIVSAALLAALALGSAAAAQSVVGIGEQSIGTVVSLHRGDTLAVTLGANATTGFSWRLTAVNRSVLRPDSTAYITSMLAPGLAGSGGVAVLTFKALARGRTTLSLAYVGPGRSPPTAKRFAVSIVVR